MESDIAQLRKLWIARTVRRVKLNGNVQYDILERSRGPPITTATFLYQEVVGFSVRGKSMEEARDNIQKTLNYLAGEWYDNLGFREKIEGMS